MTSMVDAPRLVSSDARPTHPECAVTRRSTPAAAAAVVNRNPIICADSGTTRSAASGFVAARIARAAPSFTYRTSFTSPSWLGLAPAHRDGRAVAVGRVGDVGPAQRSDLAALHAGHEEQPPRSPRRGAPARRRPCRTRTHARAARAGGRWRAPAAAAAAAVLATPAPLGRLVARDAERLAVVELVAAALARGPGLVPP